MAPARLSTPLLHFLLPFEGQDTAQCPPSGGCDNGVNPSTFIQLVSSEGLADPSSQATSSIDLASAVAGGLDSAGDLQTPGAVEKGGQFNPSPGMSVRLHANTK